MRKVALIFLTAVLAPSLVLAWLAIRSLKDQQIVAERQRTLLYDGVAQGLVKDILDEFAEIQRDFGRQVEALLAKQAPIDAAYAFDTRLLESWPLAEVGFAVSLEGSVYSPSLLGRSEARRFRLENDKFLSNRESVEFYWNSPKGAINLSKLDDSGKEGRYVSPQKGGDYKTKISSAEAEFKRLVADSSEGMLARYVQNQLKILIWYRPPNVTSMIFGAQLSVSDLLARLKPVIKLHETLQREICAVLLDDRAKPLAKTYLNFLADWKHPYVAEEVGEILPHWEVAIYPLRATLLNKPGHTAALTLGLLIGVLVFAIGVGGYLLVSDLNRELKLARLKSDFVGNVSHELKTPLTSIRMFSELLAEGRIEEPQKQKQYLEIINAETARLTRLINNVLDFSRIERGEKKYHFEPCDLAALTREVFNNYAPQLQNNGFQMELQVPESAVPIRCDRDAISQVLLNLFSNAEKYSGEGKEIAVQVKTANGSARVEVRDRGIGVPPGAEEKIFEQFYRAHDALSSGIQGSGLGLTLARQIARAHGGDVICESREGGGTTFTLELPMEL